jgi:hypothetical protein
MAEQADFPRLAPLWWNLAVGFSKPCPAIAGHPKGLGLGKIPQVDYTPNKPAGESPGSSIRTPASVRTCHELQVHVSPQNAFHCFLYLAVEPSLKPRDGKTICHEYQSFGVCNVYQRCSAELCC